MQRFLRPIAAGVLLLTVSNCTSDSPLAPSSGQPALSNIRGSAHVSRPRFDITDFSDTRRLRLTGNAHVEGQALRLTDKENSQAGAAWTRTKQRVGRGFETTFAFRVGADLWDFPGADGLAFVIQDFAPDALGADGGGLGYSGIRRSLAVEIDLWENSEFGETSRNHIAVHTRGVGPNSERFDAELGAVTPSTEMADGAVHTIRIQYIPGTLSVFLDSGADPVLVVGVDLTALEGGRIVEKSGRAWIGFTASTGAVFETHDILGWAFTPLHKR